MNHTAFIALGSNLGNRMRNLRESVEILAGSSAVELSGLSPIYESEPVGDPRQQWFLNGVARVSTSLSPPELLALCQFVEKKMGRERSTPSGPRTADLDILFFNEDVVDTGHLVIPHPRLHLRSFVLTPLSDLDPSLSHPVLKKTVGQILEDLRDPHIVRLYREVSYA